MMPKKREEKERKGKRIERCEYESIEFVEGGALDCL
jgi:hypothetical protein